MVKLYGISNCDTVKKTMVWLREHKIKFEFHDYKKEGISKKKLEEWLVLQPLEVVFNKRSAAWKQLTAAEQEKANTEAGAVSLMLEHNNLIKRPVVEISGTILVGFQEADYKKQLA